MYAIDSYNVVHNTYENYLRSNNSNTISLLREITNFELSQRLPELLLMRLDKMAMTASVESRVPFLDNRIVDFAFNLPDDLKIRGKHGKFLLKKVLEKIHPTSNLFVQKKGFGVPVNEWFRNDYKWIQDIIHNSECGKLDIVDLNYVDSLVSAHLSGKVNYGGQLWALINSFYLV